MTWHTITPFVTGRTEQGCMAQLASSGCPHPAAYIALDGLSPPWPGNVPEKPWQYDSTACLVSPSQVRRPHLASSRNIEVTQMCFNHTAWDDFPSQVNVEWNPITFSNQSCYFPPMFIFFLSPTFYQEDSITWIYWKRNNSNCQTAWGGYLFIFYGWDQYVLQ